MSAWHRQPAPTLEANGAVAMDEAGGAGGAIDYQMLFRRGREVFQSMQAQGVHTLPSNACASG